MTSRRGEDPDNVLVIHHVDSVEKARELFAMPELKEAMAQAGVKGDLRVEFFEQPCPPSGLRVR